MQLIIYYYRYYRNAVVFKVKKIIVRLIVLIDVQDILHTFALNKNELSQRNYLHKNENYIHNSVHVVTKRETSETRASENPFSFLVHVPVILQ